MSAGLAGLAAGCAVLLLVRSPSTPLPLTGPTRSAERTSAWPLLVPAVVVAGWVTGPLVLVAGLVAGLVAWGARALWRLRRRRTEAAANAARVLETCELLAAEVAAGQPPELALGRAAQAWSPLRPAAEAAALGGDVAATLRDLAMAPGAGQLRLVAAAWAVAHRTGSGLADALARVSAALRADRATARVVDGELASARATARLVAALPVLLLLLGSGADGGAWRFLLDSPLGWGCLAAGVGLGLLGLWWIERIAAEVTR